MEFQESLFNGGMNQDLSKTKVPANMYYHAYNFRISTDKGLSDTSLENIKGNTSLFTIPNLPTVQKLVIDTSVTGPMDVTISNGTFTDVGTIPFTVSSGSTPKDLYEYFQSTAGYTNLNSLYYIYYNESYLLFTPSTTTGTFTVVPSTAGLTVDSSFVPAQSNLEVIGSTHINDDIYILTTNNNTQSPGEDDPDSYGQVFKVVIDNATNTGTITNIYNNKVNFSTYNAIAPSAILGRYENSSIQRIYWTDFYNKLRSLNVADPQAFATDLTLLDVIPAVDFDIPRMINIYSGTGADPIPIGCYQVAYRLKNTAGSITQFSPVSNMVFNIGANDAAATGGANWRTYIGGNRGTTIDKRIIWEIAAVDTNYERIEFAVLIREGRDEVPSIYLIQEFPIGSQETFEFIFDGDVLNDETTSTLPLDEFLALSGAFTHCKTITSKDNRLIAGNVKTKRVDLDYDARAYRFKAANAFDIKNNGAVENYILPGGYTLVDDESDAIALYNLDSTDPDYQPTHKYKADGTTIGGEGPNVSYEFINIAVQADKGIDITNCTPAPYVSTNTNYDISSINLGVNSVQQDGTNILQIYPTAFPNGINEGIKFVQYNSVLIGYQHNEIYRQGIQFYDKAKNPYFVKWVADIKFPDYTDTCPGANHIFVDGTTTGETTYNKSFQSSVPTGTSATYVNQLGLKMSVTIPAELSEKISGFSFVRVKREQSDKTIIAEGIISNFAINSSGSDYYLGSGNMWYGEPNTSLSRAFFLTPNLLDMSLAQPSNNMFLRTKLFLEKVNTTTAICPDTDCSCTDPYQIFKLFDNNGVFTPEQRTIESVQHMDSANQYIVDGDNIFNYVQNLKGVGNHVYYFKLDSDLTDYSGFPTTPSKYFVNIVREGITQYGGNTFSARANNEYILCSHFQPVRTSVGSQSYTFNLYGGDVTNSINDDQRISKNWAEAGTLLSTTFFYPASSPVNSGLRYGAHVNRTLLGDTSSNARDTYEYNNVYSCENDIVKFFPKPDPFIEEDVFINRFHISEVKINGELLDSWAIFQPLNYWDVDGDQGAINGAHVLQDEVYFIQDKAFGKLLVNPRTAITSTDGEAIQLGRGNVIDSHDYVSTECGSVHQFSFLKSGYKLYFLDARHKKIFGFSQNRPLTPDSDIKGMHSFLVNNIYGLLETTDRPVYDASTTTGINGIHGVYDFVNDELIYTFFRGENRGEGQSFTTPYTLVYNEKLDKFTGFYTHWPKNYITNNRRFLSPNPTSKRVVYMHNYGNYGQFYGLNWPSSVDFYVNKYSDWTKKFDNIEFQTEVQDGTTLIDTASGATPVQETFNYMENSTDYQSNSTTLVVGTNLERNKRTWRTPVLKSSANAAYVSSTIKSRMMDKYLKIKMYFTNNNNKRLIFHRCLTYFRPTLPK